MKLRTLCAAAWLTVGATRAVAQQQWSPAGAARLLNATIDSVMKDAAGPTSTALTRRLWSRFDSVVAAQLNAGRSIADIDDFLARLSHFAGPGRIPGTALYFLREPSRFAPTYFAAQLGTARRGLVLAEFCYPWVNGPSHLAILRRQADAWRISDTVTSDAQYHVVGTHSDSTTPLISALETYTGADGTTSTLWLWWLRDGRLDPVPEARRAGLRNADLALSDSSIEVMWTEHLSVLDVGEMGVKRVLQTSYILRGTQLVSRTVSLNPWLDATERFVASISDGNRDAAAHSMERPDLVDSLWVIHDAKIVSGVSEEGDRDKAVGCVVIALDDQRDRKTYVRLYLQADSAFRWRIVGASSAKGSEPRDWSRQPVMGRRPTSACSGGRSH